MKVQLSFVPAGGGESDYGLPIEMPEIPHKGDYITITRPKQEGSEDFIVKRTWWILDYDDSIGIGSTKTIGVECEFAIGHYSSDQHRKTCDDYKSKKGKSLEFENSMY